MWECQFNKILPKIQHVETPEIGYILKLRPSENEIIAGIMEEKLFGFIVCTVKSPPSVVEKMKEFPPIIKRLKVTDTHLTTFMKEQVKMEKPNLKKFERETLVQCFNATDHLLLTSLAKFYMENGIKISKITQFIQYIPSKCLLPFVNHVTKMRVEAETPPNIQPMKGNTAKIYGNSGYGKASY